MLKGVIVALTPALTSAHEAMRSISPGVSHRTTEQQAELENLLAKLDIK